MLHVEDLQAIWVDMIDSISNLFCKRYLILRIRKTFYFYNEHVITLLVSDLFLNILHVPRELKYSILCRSRVNTLHWFTSITWWLNLQFYQKIRYRHAILVKHRQRWFLFVFKWHYQFKALLSRYLFFPDLFKSPWL